MRGVVHVPCFCLTAWFPRVVDRDEGEIVYLTWKNLIFLRWGFKGCKNV